jgi:hypothetical protein
LGHRARRRRDLRAGCPPRRHRPLTSGPLTSTHVTDPTLGQVPQRGLGSSRRRGATGADRTASTWGVMCPQSNDHSPSRS